MIKSSPSTATRTPQPARPAAIAERRSLSLTRSSARPRITVRPQAQAAATARIGYSSIIRGARSAGISAPVRVPARARMSATGSPPSSRRFTQSDIGAHLGEAFEKTGAQRVDADAFDRHLGTRNDQARDQGKGGRRRVARHDDRRGRHFGKTFDGDPDPAALFGLCRDRRPEVAQHPLGVIAGRLALDHGGGPRRVEPGEQYRGFDLGRGYRQTIDDRDRIDGAADCERQADRLRG